MATLNDNIILEIRRRAALFVADNFSKPSPADLLLTESVMMIGASIALEADAADLNGETKTLEELFDKPFLTKESEHVKQQRMGRDTL